MTRLTRWLSGPTTATRRPSPRRALRLEALEGREVPAVITVTSLADNLDTDGLVTLREAVQAANTNASVDGSTAGDGVDTIVFAAGLTGTITLALGQLALTDTALTTIDGDGGITVDGNNASRVFHVAGGAAATLRGLTISRGRVSHGGGVFNEGTLTVAASSFSDNETTASFGGGLFSVGPSLTVTDTQFTGNSSGSSGGGVAIIGGVVSLTDVVFSNNTAASGGGVYVSSGTVTVTVDRATVQNNTADSGGGFALLGGTVQISNSTVTNNQALSGTGGGLVSYIQVSVTDSTISNNSATGSGGGIYVGAGTITITGCQLVGNSSGESGGGIVCSSGFGHSISNTVLSGNTATDNGGGIVCTAGSNVSLSQVTVTNNTASSGGGVYNSSGTTLVISGSTISGNTATQGGGGVTNIFGGNLSVSTTSVSGNTAGTDGGGFHSSSGAPLAVTESDVSDNTAANHGGGLYLSGGSPLTVTRSTVADNTADDHGGGIYATAGVTGTVTGSTIVGNSADIGGGVHNGFSLTFTGVTIAGNTATSLGGALWNGDTVTLGDSLLVGNTAPSDPDISGTFTDFGGNLIGVPGGFTLSQVIAVDGSGNLLLANNGGPTKTVALVDGSPAVGKGVGSGGVDQRGVTRSVPPDAGAFQSQPVSVSATATGGVANGSPVGVTDATVTGVSGPLATFGDPTLAYHYYAGTLTTGQIATATPLAGAPTAPGNYTVVARFTTAGYTNTVSPPVHFTITPAPVSPPTIPPVGPPVLVATAPGSSPAGTMIKVFDPVTGRNTRDLVPFAGFHGAVDVASGDFNGDGVADVVVAAGAGGGPRVCVFDGATGAELASFFAFDTRFTGGVAVAVGDVTGDGTPDLIVAAGSGGGPHVKVFAGTTFAEVSSFYAYAPTFLGGVSVAGGDVDGDGKADIVTGAGAGIGPHVKVFSGSGLSLLYSVFAFSPTFTGGVSVAAGDVNGDGFADLIVGAGAGGQSQVAVYDGKDGAARGSFRAFVSQFAGGVNVGAMDGDGDGTADIVAAAGTGGDPHLMVFQGGTFAPLASSYAFDRGLLGGLSVG